MQEFDGVTSSDRPSSPPGPRTGRLETRLRAGEFAVVCEMSPPRGASLEPLRKKAGLVRDWADAALVTDGQGAQVRMAGWAGCLAVMAEGVEPMLQVQGRDQNRLAIQADLLGAAGAGIPNVLLQSGDRVSAGDHPDAAESFDLDSLAAIRAAVGMKNKRQLMSGRELSPAPHWFIGCVENATAGGGGRIQRLADKIDAGAQFVLTQYIFDVDRFRDWMGRLRDRGLDQRCYVLPGVGPVMSRNAFDFIEALPDVYIPDAVKRRLRSVPEDRMAAEGLALAVETLQAVQEVAGLAGVYLLTSEHEDVVGELLDGAGVGGRSTPLL